MLIRKKNNNNILDMKFLKIKNRATIIWGKRANVRLLLLQFFINM